VYRFTINARTGELIGKRPYSVTKIVLTIIGGLALIGGIVYLVAAK
jgi:hypothetical protein